MGLKEFYYSLEDKWYEIIEKLHLEGIVDKIDRVIPSFALFCIIVLFLAGFLIWNFLILKVPIAEIEKGVKVKLKVLDVDGNPIGNARVIVKIEKKYKSYTTAENGIVEFYAKENSKVNVRVSKKGYKETAKNITVGKKTLEFRIVLEEKIKEKTRVLILFSKDGSLLEGVEATVSFKCSNPAAIPPKEVTTKDGYVKIKEPINCGNLIAKVTVANFNTADGIELKDKKTIVKLEEKKMEPGSLVITTMDEKNEPLDNIQIQVFSEEGILYKQELTKFGKIEFSLMPGKYFVIAVDTTGKYSSKKSDILEIKAGMTTRLSIKFEKEPIVKLKVVVKDAESNEPIANALVMLIQQQSLVASGYADENGTIMLYLSDLGVFKLRAVHDDYLYEEKELNLKKGSYEEEILLEKLTPENSGRVIVKVVDEDNNPVENAKVAIYDANTGFIYPMQQALYTDANGIAALKGVKEGKYYFEAFKAHAHAKTEEMRIKLREINRVEIKLTIGDAKIKIRVRDEENKAVSNAVVRIFSESGKELGSINTDEDGCAEFTTKADKKIFLEISKENYSKYTSLLYDLYPNAISNIDAVLSRELLGDVRVEFLGLYEGIYGNKIEKVEAGNTYLAKFLVYVPKKVNAEKVAFYARVGSTEIIDNDNIVIKEVNMPLAITTRGKTYSAPLGSEIDMENLTTASAKWILTERDAEEGIYEIGIEIGIKKTAPPGKRLPLYYRTYVIDSGDNYLRDPYDAELGNAESSANKQGLYANTYEIYFWEGLDKECEEFCYYGERFYEESSELIFTEKPYNILISGKGKLYFEIFNNSDVIYKGNIELIAENLKIVSYSIRNADGLVFEADDIYEEKLENLSVGEFGKGKAIYAEIGLFGLEEGKGNLKIRIKEQQSIVFEKEIGFNIIAEKIAELKVENDELFSYLKSNVKVKVTEEGIGLEGVRINVTKKFGKEEIAIGSGYTDAKGEFSILIPACKAGTKIIFEARKRGYYINKETLEVSSKIVSFDPSKANMTVELIGERNPILNITIENLTGIRIIGYNAVLHAENIKSLVEVEQAEDFAKNAVSLISLNAKDVISSDILQLKLRSDIMSLVPREEEIELWIYLEGENGRIWLQILPIEVEFRIGGELKNRNCLVLEGDADWEETALNGKTEKQYFIYNRCIDKSDKEVELQNLKAELSWYSEEVADIIVQVTESATQTTAIQTLSEGSEALILGRILPESQSQYTVKIQVLPKVIPQGQNARFDISFKGYVETDYGLDPISATKSIDADILITDLAKCIKVDEGTNMYEPIIMEEDEDEIEFEIDTSDCGDLELDIRLCEANDPNCKGGTTDGGIKFGNRLGNEIEDVSGSVDIKVERALPGGADIPGLYAIPIFAKLSDSGVYQKIKTVYVFIEPKRLDCGNWLKLAKEHHIIPLTKEGASFKVDVTNREVFENVKVKARVKHWKRMKKTMPWHLLFTMPFKKAPATAYKAMDSAVAGAATGAIIGSVIPGLGTLIGAAIGAVVGFISDLIYQITKAKKWKTRTLQDYSISLIGVFKDKDLPKLLCGSELCNVEINWDFNNMIERFDEDSEMQSVNLIIKDKGISHNKNQFAVLEVTAKEYLHKYHAGNPKCHGNDEKSNGVKCKTSNFGPFYLFHCEGFEERIYKQKFHVMLKVKEEVQELPYWEFDKEDCQLGSLTGVTGSEAKPKELLTWDPQNMDEHSCKENYCDAAQFATVVSKRLMQLESLIPQQMTCPQAVTGNIETGETTKAEHTLQAGTHGLIKLENIFNAASNSLSVEVTYQNATQNDVNATVKVELLDMSRGSEEELGEVIDSCEIEFDVKAAGVETQECDFGILQQGNYLIRAIPQSNNANLDDTQLNTIQVVMDVPYSNTECWVPKTTRILSGEPLIFLYEEIKNNNALKEQLKEVLSFKVRLKRENFSEDFLRDFAEFEKFATTESWFKEKGKKLFLQEKIKFNFAGSSFIPTPGLYEAKLFIDFKDSGNSFRMFDDDGNPLIGVEVMLSYLGMPDKPSIFYYLPWDGEIGLEEDKLKRNGYGVGYYYSDPTKRLILNKGISPVKLYQTEGNPLVKLTVEDRSQDLRYLNSMPESRGNLLSISLDDDLENGNLRYSPSVAKPILARIEAKQTTEEKFDIFYALLEGDSRIDVGNNLTTWQGYGNCLDFSGKPIWEKFFLKWDMHAEAGDLPETSGVYKLSWDSIVNEGKIFLRTIIFSNNPNLALKSFSDSLRFIDESENLTDAVLLNNTSQISSIEEMLDEVENKRICVSDTGLSIKLWHNPKEIYSKLSKSQEEIEAECIPIGG